MSKEKREGWVCEEAIFRYLSHPNVLINPRIYWDQFSHYRALISQFLHFMVPYTGYDHLFPSYYFTFYWVQTIKDYIFECILYRGSRKRFFIIWWNNIYKEAWQFQSFQPTIGRIRSRNTSLTVQEANFVETCHCFIWDINAITASYLYSVLGIRVQVKEMYWE